MPMPCADSTMAGSTSRSPTIVFATIGSSEYMTSATTTGVVPIPNTLMKRPNRASDGIVRNTDVVAMRSCRERGWA